MHRAGGRKGRGSAGKAAGLPYAGTLRGLPLQPTDPALPASPPPCREPRQRQLPDCVHRRRAGGNRLGRGQCVPGSRHPDRRRRRVPGPGQRRLAARARLLPAQRCLRRSERLRCAFAAPAPAPAPGPAGSSALQPPLVRACSGTARQRVAHCLPCWPPHWQPPSPAPPAVSKGLTVLGNTVLGTAGATPTPLVVKGGLIAQLATLGARADAEQLGLARAF